MERAAALRVLLTEQEGIVLRIILHTVIGPALKNKNSLRRYCACWRLPCRVGKLFLRLLCEIVLCENVLC